MRYLVFQSTGGSDGWREPRRLPPGYEMETWRPDWRHIVPPTLGPKFALWWALHECRLFRNRDYSALLIRYEGRVVHRTCLIPKYFRWPFMADSDLQISSTWTHPEYRCLGLATFALQSAVEQWAAAGRTLWYVTHVENAPSLAVCNNIGFVMKTAAVRTYRFGLRVLGHLELLEEG
jgi:GNAT superfamily N-acetyltransferase